MKLFTTLVALLPMIFLSCKRAENDRQLPVSTTLTSDNDAQATSQAAGNYDRVSIIQIIAKKSASGGEIKEILNDIVNNDNSRFKNLTPSQKLLLLNILVDQMSENSVGRDELYQVLTGLQTMCLPNKRKDWQDWLKNKSAEDIDWVF